jgi:hypothetical protein
MNRITRENVVWTVARHESGDRASIQRTARELGIDQDAVFRAWDSARRAGLITLFSVDDERDELLWCLTPAGRASLVAGGQARHADEPPGARRSWTGFRRSVARRLASRSG